MSATSWVDIVGYQHEAVHDGALVALLRSEPEIARPVATALLGRSVSDVSDARRQARVGQAQVDVAIDVVAGGASCLLAVETKVDSQSTREQLQRTASDGDEAVMLAVGNSAMRTCTVARAYRDEPGQRVIDVTAWTSILERLPPLPDPLDQYRLAVAREAEEHARARRIVRGEEKFAEFVARLGDELLAWAWLDETWRTLERTADPGHLYAHKAISGPILFWEDSWEDFASASGGLYLDVMAEGDKRVIVLKAADVPADERVSLFDAVAATAPSGSKAPARRSLRGNTFRVRIWDVTGDSPATGAAVALDAQRYLRSFAASR